MLIRAAAIAAAALSATACAQTTSTTSTAAPAAAAASNAETRAFQRADGRLKWRDARISYDANNCAVYQGRDLYGTTRTELLRNVDNSTFCGAR